MAVIFTWALGRETTAGSTLLAGQDLQMSGLPVISMCARAACSKAFVRYVCIPMGSLMPSKAVGKTRLPDKGTIPEAVCVECLIIEAFCN